MCLYTTFLTHVNIHHHLVAELPHLSILFYFSWAWHLLISVEVSYLSEMRQWMSLQKVFSMWFMIQETSGVCPSHPFSCLKHPGVYHQSLYGSLSIHLNTNSSFLCIALCFFKWQETEAHEVFKMQVQHRFLEELNKVLRFVFCYYYFLFWSILMFEILFGHFLIIELTFPQHASIS